MSILITTYEGNHNHPLPMSATAMASTTSAAASMLIAGSSTSLSSSPTPINGGQSDYSGHHSLNFGIPNGSRTIPPFFLPNTTISPSPSYSTITLDLTSPPSLANSQTSQFNKLSSNSSFSISMPSSSWNGRGYMACGTHDQSYKPNFQYSMQAMSSNCLTDSIAKALTSDPTFHSALQAAITSYVGASAGQREALNPYGHNYGGTTNIPSTLSGKQGSFMALPSPLSSTKIGTTQSTMDISWENMK